MKNIYIVYILLAVFSCKAPQYVAVQTPNLPVNNFDTLGKAITDSTSIGSKAWKDIFRDEHLKKLIGIALQNNNGLLAFQEKINVSNAHLMVAKNLRKPSLQANIQTNAERFGNFTLNGVGNYDLNKSSNISAEQRVPTAITPDLFTGFRSNWEIDIWGQLKTKAKVAAFDVSMVQNEKHVLTTDIVATIAVLYYQLLAFDEELRMLANNSVLQKDALDIVIIQKEAGRANELAVQQFEAQYLKTQALIFDVKQQIVAIENQINYLCGQQQQRIVRSTSFIKNELPINLLVGNINTLLSNRPDIVKAELQLQKSRGNITIARLAYFPSFSLNPYIGLSSFSALKLLSPESIAFGILGGLQFPIFTKKQNEANWQIAQAANKEAYYLYKDVVTKSIAEVQTQVQAVENTRAQLNLKEQETNILVAAIATADNLYKAGQANYLEVLTARRNALDANIEAINTKRNLFIAAIQLYKALGGGWQ
jgi:outer membrane protein, multidrug efflux system